MAVGKPRERKQNRNDKNGEGEDEFRRNSNENANTTRVSRLNGAHQFGDRSERETAAEKERGEGFFRATFQQFYGKEFEDPGRRHRCVPACEITSNDVTARPTAILNAPRNELRCFSLKRPIQFIFWAFEVFRECQVNVSPNLIWLRPNENSRGRDVHQKGSRIL